MDVCGVADAGPKREDTGAGVVGVANNDEAMEEEDGAEGVLKSPLPDEAVAVAADVCGAVDAA